MKALLSGPKPFQIPLAKGGPIRTFQKKETHWTGKRHRRSHVWLNNPRVGGPGRMTDCVEGVERAGRVERSLTACQYQAVPTVTCLVGTACKMRPQLEAGTEVTGKGPTLLQVQQDGWRLPHFTWGNQGPEKLL